MIDYNSSGGMELETFHRPCHICGDPVVNCRCERCENCGELECDCDYSDRDAYFEQLAHDCDDWWKIKNESE